MEHGTALISQNNKKSCCDCGKKILKGEFCWRVQRGTSTDGSRHLCEACTVQLTRAVYLDVLGSRIEGGRSERVCQCCRCKSKIERDDRLGKIRIRPYGTEIHKGKVRRVARKISVCTGCLIEMGEEIKAYRKGGVLQHDAPRYLAGNSDFLREYARRALDG